MFQTVITRQYLKINIAITIAEIKTIHSFDRLVCRGRVAILIKEFLTVELRKIVVQAFYLIPLQITYEIGLSFTPLLPQGAKYRGDKQKQTKERELVD